MIAQAQPRADSVPAWHATFLQMQPAIERQASVAFRGLSTSEREELIAEVIANALVAFAGLIHRGKADIAYPTPLATYAIRQVRVGRRVGTKLNGNDVSSRYCQRKNHCAVERLDRYDREDQGWQEIVVEDRQAGPAETAAMRLDFADWLRRLSTRDRHVADALAAGEGTLDVSRAFGISPARVSQLRRELQQDWRAFQGELASEPEDSGEGRAASADPLGACGHRVAAANGTS